MAGWFDFVNGQTLPASRVQDYLMDQSVMVFADATARDAALGLGWTEGMVVYLVNPGALFVRRPLDWIRVTDNDNFAAQSATLPTRRNAMINGGFDIWQRGTTFTTPGDGVYTADRWYANSNANVMSTSQQTFTPGAAPVSGYESPFFIRFSKGAGTNAYNSVSHRVEDVRNFAGQTATISFWAKAATSQNVSVGFDQVFGSGGSGTVGGSFGTAALTTAWQRFTYTATIPSISGKTVGSSSFLSIGFSFPTTTAFTIDLWGVQLEAGSGATPFVRAATTLQGELAACQRYYQRFGGLNTYQSFGLGFADQTTTAIIQVPLPVTMRVAPTSVDFSSLNLSTGATNNAVTGLSILSNQNGNGIAVVYPTVASGLTQFRSYSLTANNSTNGYLGLNAEL